MSDPKPCRIGVIGLGQRIAHVLCAMHDVGWRFDRVSYVDPGPIGAPIMHAAGIAIGDAFSSVADLIASGPFDLLMIGSPNHLHFGHLMAALDTGWPIFTEKPIVRTEEESYRLAERLAAPGNPPVYVGLVMRSMSIVREVLARIDAGEIGEVVSIDATEHLHPEHGAYLARNWRRRQEWSGSYLLDKVCHDFDIFGRIAGARAAKVASFGGRAVFHSNRADPPRHYDDGAPAYALHDAGWSSANDPFQSDMDITDHQMAIVEYANGVLLSFHANSHTALQERRWYVAGTEGTLIADLVRNRLMVRRAMDRGKPLRIDYGDRTEDNHNGADQAMARDLLAALSGERPFPVTPRESLEAGLTVMAIDRAMSGGVMLDCAPMWERFDAATGQAQKPCSNARS